MEDWTGTTSLRSWVSARDWLSPEIGHSMDDVKKDRYFDGYRERYSRQTEGRIVRKIVKALAAAGNPVTAVWDGEEECPVDSMREVLQLASNLDQLHLYTKDDSWVFIVNGNDWDALSDYTINLDEDLKPINAWIDARS